MFHILLNYWLPHSVVDLELSFSRTWKSLNQQNKTQLSRVRKSTFKIRIYFNIKLINFFFLTCWIKSWIYSMALFGCTYVAQMSFRRMTGRIKMFDFWADSPRLFSMCYRHFFCEDYPYLYPLINFDCPTLGQFWLCYSLRNQKLAHLVAS